MRKTSANPDRLVHRAQRHVQDVERQLAALCGILKTLGAAIAQGDVSDKEDIRERLRWVEHEEALLCASLDTVIAQTSELMRQLDATCSPEGFAIAPFPEAFQEDMDQSFQQTATCSHQVLSPPQVPPRDQQTPSQC